METQDLIKDLMNKGYLISSEVMDELDKIEEILDLDAEKTDKGNFLTLEKLNSMNIKWKPKDTTYKILKDKNINFNSENIIINKNSVMDVKDNDDFNNSQQNSAEKININIKQNNYIVKIIENYNKESKKREIQDFVKYYNARFKTFEKLLSLRNLKNLTSISRIKKSKAQDKITIIGMVLDKRTTNNGNIILSLEDLTDKINVIITQRDQEQFLIAKDIVLDEVLAIEGQVGDNIIFCSSIILPDIPEGNLKKSKDEVYLALIGDVHFGSVLFMEEEFKRLIKWLRGESGNEKQKEIARKTKYIVITGDLIEGIGIYPGQEKDLIFKDVKEQYKFAHDFLMQIPSDKNIIIFPGNHDAGRLAEPQLSINKKYAEELYDMNNVFLVSNPSVVNIHSSKTFEGFNLLLYHGYSFFYYADNVESIRKKGGQDRSDLIMKLLLKKRHIAPTHESNQFIPDNEEDPLIISKVPDFFITGHIHRVSVSNYKSVTMLNCSGWVRASEYQIKNGVIPQPAKLPIVNLKTREVKILNFLKEKK